MHAAASVYSTKLAVSVSSYNVSAALDKFVVGSATVIKNITKEVLRDCAKIGVYIDESVVAFAVRLLCLDPANGLQLNRTYERRELEEFVGKCVERLKDDSDPCVKTLYMQVFSIDHVIDTERIFQAHSDSMHSKTAKLTNDLLSAQNSSKNERDKLFKKLTLDIIVNNYLGSASNQKLFQDVFAALSSVMGSSDVVRFFQLKRDARLDLLYDYRTIVCGIYVYNKDSGLCGRDLADIGSLVAGGQANTEAQLGVVMEEIGNRISTLTSFMNRHFNQVGEMLAATKNDEQHCADAQTMINVLIMQRQHMSYLVGVSRTMAKVRAEVECALRNYKKKLKLIREKVQFRTAIPTEDIFPHFTELSLHWHRLQGLVFVLSEVNIVNDRLMELNDEVYSWEPICMRQLGDIAIEPVVSNTSSVSIESNNPLIRIVDYMNNMRIEFNAFCPTTLVNGKGLLLNGNPRIGVVEYRDKFYMFRTELAAQTFLKQPDALIFSVVETARQHPDLIILLDIFELVRSYRNEFHSARRPTVIVSSAEIEVQTDVHPETGAHFDPSYVWNVWDYRRQAIQFANLLKSQTTSAQTNVSYQRMGVETQTWSPRESGAQTRKDTATNVPRPMRYVRGIRGRDGTGEDDGQTENLTNYVEDEVR